MADFFFLTVEFIIIAVAVPGWSLSFYSPSSSSPSPSSSSPSSSSAKTSLVRQTLTIVKSLLIEGSGWAQFQTITLFIMRKKRRKRARKFWARGDPREKSCGTFGKLFNMVQSCQIGQSCSFYSFRHCCKNKWISLSGGRKICSRLKQLKRIMRAALVVASKCHQGKGGGGVKRGFTSLFSTKPLQSLQFTRENVQECWILQKQLLSPTEKVSRLQMDE